LLGVNGAGKTTTFKTLSNEVQPSYGQVLIGGYEVAKNFDIVKRMIGYCPQYTKLVGEMSIEQTLWYFATIRGVDRAERAALVEDVISDLGLGIHRHKQIRNLSGGNQRKVSFAIAVMGNPDVILLDEPSAGVDPDARRYLQAQVRRIAAQKTSAIVMTSHSMEEAESVSSKMGIMVKGGQFKCFGSAQHIRSKFMTGFVIEIKITNLEQEELEAHQQRFMREGTLMHEDVAWLSEELKDSLQAVNLNDVQDEQTERDLIQSMHVQISQLQCS
jgi:ABC-type multidrug transport system ATPase subunit